MNSWVYQDKHSSPLKMQSTKATVSCLSMSLLTLQMIVASLGTMEEVRWDRSLGTSVQGYQEARGDRHPWPTMQGFQDTRVVVYPYTTVEARDTNPWIGVTVCLGRSPCRRMGMAQGCCCEWASRRNWIHHIQSRSRPQSR
jgi:hypothetical protein